MHDVKLRVQSGRDEKNFFRGLERTNSLRLHEKRIGPSDGGGKGEAGGGPKGRADAPRCWDGIK